AVVAPGLVGTASQGTGISNVNFIAGDVFTNTTSGPLDVVYTITPYRLGCPGEPFTITVTIKPEPVVANQTGSTCSDAPTGIVLGNDVDGPSAATYNITAINPNGLTASAGSPAVANGVGANEIANDAWTNATNASVDVIYTVVPVSADGCEGNAFTVTVTIQPEPVVAFQTLTVCSDEVLGLNLGNDPNGPTVSFYDITGINPNGLTASAGSPATGMGLLANVIADDAWTNLTNAPVDVIYSVIPYGSNGCPGNPFAVTITVKPEPLVVSFPSSMVCSDVAIGVELPGVDDDGLAITSYDISAMVHDSLSGSPTEGTGLTGTLVLAMDAYNNVSTSAHDVVYTITPYSDGCPGASFTVTVTVKPEPVVEDQTAGVCSDTPIGVTLGNDADGPAAATYNITAINPNGLMASAGSPTTGTDFTDGEIEDDAWTNPGIDPVDVIYTVVPVSADGCEGDEFTVTVTISAEPVVDDQTDMTCSDVAIGVILNDDPDGPAVSSYNIVSIDSSGMTSSAGSPVVGTGFSNTEIMDDAWTNTTSGPLDVIYTIVPVSGGCEGDEFTVTVTIKPEPVVEDQTSMTCSDVATGVTLGASTNGTPAASYTITEIMSNGLTASAGSPTTGTGFSDSEISDDAWTNTTGAPVDVIYKVVPVSADGCEGDEFTVTVTVKSEPVVNNQSQSICSDVASGVTLGASTNATAAATYNITNIQNNGLLASAGAPMTGTGLPANIIMDDAWTNQGIVPVNVVYTVVPVSAEGCEGNAFTVTLTVAPEPVLDVPGAPVTVCSDEPLSSAWGGITTLNGQPLSYINLISVTDNTASPNFIPGPGNAAFPAGAVAVNYFDNDQYTNLTSGGVTVSYQVVAVTPGGCASDPVTYEFQIRAEPVLSPDLDTTVCSGNPIGVELALNPALGFQNVTGYDIVAITPEAGLTGGGPAATGNNQPANAIAGDIWENPTNGPLNVVYTVIPRRGGGPCFGDPVDITVTIEPFPVAALALDAGGSQDTVRTDNSPYMLMVCSDEPFSAQAISDVVPTPGRDLWLQAEISDPDNVLGNGTSFTILAPYGSVAFNDSIHNETAAPYMITVTFTPFINFNSDQTLDPEECAGDPFVLQLVVKPEPVAVATPSDTEICDDGTFTVDLDDNGSSVEAASFEVYTDVPAGLTQTSGNTTPNGTVSFSGPTAMIMDQYSNGTTGTLTVTYTIVPISADGCSGDAVTVEVDIWARPSTAPAPNMVCKGTNATIMPNVTLGSGGSISTYQWTYLGTTASNFRINGGPLLNPGSVIGSPYTTTDILINTTSPLATTGIIGFELVVTDVNGCTSEPVEIYIEVKPVPNAGTNGSFGPICETFGNINLFSLLGGTPDAGGVWTADPGNPTGGTLAGPNFNPAGSVGGTYLFTYTIDNGVCTPVSSTVTVQVQPNANAGTFDILADNDVCEDEPSFNLFTLLSGTAGVNYDAGGTWAELTSSGAGLNASTGELDLTTAIPGNYTFRYTVNVGPTACPNPVDFEEVVLNIIAAPAPNPILGNATPCVNTTANYALTTPVVMGVTRLWSLSGGGTITSGTTGSSVTIDWGGAQGTFTLTCVSSRLGCETVNTLEVTVGNTESGFTYTVGSMDGLTINFTDTSTGGPTIWFWDFGDGETSLDQNPSHTYGTEGTYMVCLDVIGDCGSDQYCENVIVTAQVQCDEVTLNSGLNLISIDVVPADSSIETMFANQILAGELIYIQGRNSSGGVVVFDPLLIPFPGLNTLTNFERGKGYYVRTNAGSTLTVCGEPIDPNFKTNLNATWNIIGYVPQTSTTPETYFADLIPPISNNLQIARGFDGSFKFFDPLLIPFPGLNTLTSLDNGFGYELRVMSAVNGVDWIFGQDPDQLEIRNTEFVTDQYMVIAAKSDLTDSYIGEEVLVVNATGKVLGIMDVLPGGLLKTTPLYGNDSYSQEEGVQDGDWLYLKFKDKIVPLNLQFHADRSIRMLDVSFALPNQVGNLVEDKASLIIAPNPFAATTRINLELKESADISVIVRDIFGKAVDFPGKLGRVNAGTYHLEWTPIDLPSGVYVMQLVIDGVVTDNQRVTYQRP
ncbi:MAG: PKD domain-containing protein, partial [Lewinella sp.]|nr:PKD domain-containing protein [Lewinella sp.]